MSNEEHRFRVIPVDFCPRCLGGEAGMPGAIAEQGGGVRLVRYVCGECRLIWDTWWNVEGVMDSYRPFMDRRILSTEGLESHRFGEGPDLIVMPIGPASLIEQHQLARRSK